MTNIGTHKQLNSLRDIPESKYSGYYWISNETTPRIVDDEFLNLSDFYDGKYPTVPFIVEAAFYNDENNESVMIRHMDGSYRIDCINWNNGENGEITEQSFLAVSSLKNKKIRLRTAWALRSDDMTENMTVLTPAWTGFCGFEDQGKENNND